MKPDVMLFDEPTSALDPELVGEIIEDSNPEKLFTSPEHPRIKQFIDKML